MAMRKATLVAKIKLDFVNTNLNDLLYN